MNSLTPFWFGIFSNMASSGGGLQSFFVGQISEFLSKSHKRNKDDDNNSGLKSLFSSSSAVQPVFVPVVEKKTKRKVIDENVKQEEPKPKKQKIKNALKTVTKNQESNDEGESKRISQDDPERMERTIFVGNVPVTLTKKGLKKIFDKYGAIESIRFRSAALAKPNLSRKVGMKKKEFHKERHTLNGYIVFENRAHATEALQSNGEEVEGVHLRVDLAKNDKVHDHSKSVFVGNLPFVVEEEHLREVFKGCGDIESVRLVRDSETGIGKGFGFILFKDKDSVGFALKLNQSKFKGRPLRVFPSSEHPRKGQVTKVKKGKPLTHSFSGAQAKKNQKLNKPKHTKRKERPGNKTGTKKSKDHRTKRSTAYKQTQLKKRKQKK